MNLYDYREELNELITKINLWEKKFPEFSSDESLSIDKDKFKIVAEDFLKRLEDNYPFFHPLYVGQLLKPPHPVAMLGYIAAMMINPNNHALDGGPATARMEKEVVALHAEKFGFKKYIGHLTSSGTIANLEALWISRELNPEKYIVFSDQAHYTHKRYCNILRAKFLEVETTPQGRVSIGKLEKVICNNNVGTVVITLGTTGLGALDELDKVLELKDKYGFRIHIDAAYGGYYKLIDNFDKSLRQFKYLNKAESLVFDPHKHGLQPYGCGCVLFADPEVGKLYKHDSPYTYFTSDDLHLGEISLECSRAGASAAALWLTTKVIELESDKGFGEVLKKTRKAAVEFAKLLKKNDKYELYIDPDLDIITFFPKATSTGKISELTDKIFERLMNIKNNPLFLAKLKLNSSHFGSLHSGISVNTKDVTIFRSCMLKPEHLNWVHTIVKILDENSIS